MFPANVYAAVEGITTRADDALLPRTLLQVVFLAATVAVLVRSRRPAAQPTVAPETARV
jgi:hypothetical protein